MASSDGAKDEGSTGVSMILSALMSTAAQPLNCVKILVQVGHEPIPPTPARTFFGTKVLRLSSFFQYAAHIRRVDGWTGLYRGLGPRIWSGMVSTVVHSAVLKSLEEQSRDTEDENPDAEQQQYQHETLKEIVAKCAAVTMSHPFHVISVRMVVQFVGKETLYSGIASSMKEIYTNEGIMGFFVGLVPRLLAEVISLCIHRTLFFMIKKHAMNKENSGKKEIQMYISAIAQYLAATITYPFSLTSNLIIVNHVGLAVGESPQMPVFTSWWGCFKYLRNTKNLWRGSSLFRRTAPIPLGTSV